ncbi:MAG: sugar ABC transporter substrate-binding protein [Chloroflexi bacterium]|nr:sugar ABC transporter substrate-binding protein [Chloroflexota bacterium]
MAGIATLGACEVTGGQSGDTAKPGRFKTGITLNMMQYGTQPEGESKLQVLKMFEEKYPGIKTSLDNTGGSGYADKLQAMTAAGTPPDAFWFNPSLYLVYVRRGFFLDLSPVIRRDKYDLSDFAEKSLQQYNWEGKQWAMPKDFPTRGMFFDVSVFDQSGVAHPPTNYSDQSWTWDRFLEAAQKLSRERGGVTHFGLQSGTGFRQWTPWVHGNGGEFVNKDCIECLLHEAPAIEALQFLQDLRVKHRIWALRADTQQGATFPLGRVGITESAPPGVGTLRREIQGFVWDATHVPRGKNGKYAASGGGTGQSVAGGTKYPDEAWELLKHLLNPEALHIEIVKDQLNMPARKSLANSKEYLNSGLPPRNLKVFVDGLPYLRPDPQTTNWDEISRALDQEMRPLWSGEKSPREVAMAVKRVVDPLLKQAEAKRRL